MTTMKDVARATGVSVMTVSRAFKPNSSISDKKKELIRKVAEEMGYVYDSTAANLRAQRTDFIAVTIPSLNNANFADTVRALSDTLAETGRQVLLGFTNYDMAEEEHLVEQLLRRRPEAIVVTGGRHTDRTRRLLAGAGIPVIETWDMPENPIGHVVGFSNAAAMHQLVDHLAQTGRTRIGFIGGDADGDTRGADRRRGFISAMQAAGFDADLLISAGRPPISMREGATAMGRLLDGQAACDAVICVSDLSAFGALSECMRRNIRVPQDMAIAGFGSYEIADVCVPSMTTIDPNASEIGARTGALILDILDKTPNATPQSLSIVPQLKLAGSTGVGDL